VPARISVIVLTYNHEHFLADALDSILSQSAIDDVEILISEDASTDDTRAVVARYADAHKDKIRTFFSPQNLRSVEVFNRAIREARGEYIAYIDGDDVWTDPDKLAKQVALFDANPDVTLCYHNADLVDATLTPLGRTHVVPGSPATTLRGLILTNPVPACAICYRASAILPLPDFMDRAPCADWPLHLVAAQKGEIAYIDEVMAAYRQHEGGAWTSIPWRERYEMFSGWFAFVREEVLPEEHHRDVEAAGAYWAVAAEIHGGNPISALGALQTALSIDPDIDYYFSMFVTLAGTPTELRSLIDVVTMVAPSRADYFGWLAVRAADLDALEECRKATRGAFAASDGMEGPTEQVGHQFHRITRYLRERGLEDEAETTLEKAVALLPEADGLRLQLANRLINRDDIDGAIELLREAIALNDQEIRYPLRLAGLYHKKKRFKEEVALLEKAVALDPARADPIFRLAVALLADGRRDDGIAALRRCLEREPQHERARERLTRLGALTADGPAH